MKEIALHPITGRIPGDVADGRLKKACTEFEALFLNHILKSMRKGIMSNGPLGNSNEMKIMRSMSDEALARGIATGGGVGLADILFEQLKNSLTVETPPPTRDEETGNRSQGGGKAASPGRSEPEKPVTDSFTRSQQIGVQESGISSDI